MTPVIKHLHNLFAGFPLYTEPSANPWMHTKQLRDLGPDFYAKILPLHPSLNLEYSMLCVQLRHELSSKPIKLTRKELINRLTDALLLAQLLEHLHRHYLVVPREVKRLQAQQQIFNGLLSQLNVFPMILESTQVPADVRSSFSQLVRDHTAAFNWYRMITTRSKRVLNFLDQVAIGWTTFRESLAFIDKYANPFFAHLAWLFFLPRLLVNLFLTLKHSIPGMWMTDKEAATAWYLRLWAQMQRRWFEMANDVLWFALGFVNCFFFFGSLAPIGVCLNLVGFFLDVVISGARVYIELNRLSQLSADYELLASTAMNKPDELKAIRDYQSYITQRTQFEQLRLYLHLANTTAIFLAMCLAIPVLIVNPMFPLIGAVLLVAIWGVSFSLTRKLETYRPSEVIEPVDLSGLAADHDVDNQAPLDAPVRVDAEPSNPNHSTAAASRLSFFAEQSRLSQQTGENSLLADATLATVSTRSMI